VIVDVCAVKRGANDAIVTAHLNAPAFPYQKLKNEFQRQRELLGLFFDKCPVFRQLATSYGNALEAFANRDIENIVRNLAVATELVFAKEHSDEIQSRKLLHDEGAMLLSLDWLRDQFQSLSFLTKARSPGLSEERDPLQIHLHILGDERWRSYVTQVNASALLRW
jgi:hypothetical protein